MNQKYIQQTTATLSEALAKAFEQANANLLWINKEKQRYYRATLQRDLLNDLIVVQSWGGIGSRRGGMKNQFFADLAQVRAYVKRLHSRRLKHGYILK